MGCDMNREEVLKNKITHRIKHGLRLAGYSTSKLMQKSAFRGFRVEALIPTGTKELDIEYEKLVGSSIINEYQLERSWIL